MCVCDSASIRKKGRQLASLLNTYPKQSRRDWGIKNNPAEIFL